MLSAKSLGFTLCQIFTVQSGALTFDWQGIEKRSGLCPFEFNIIIRGSIGGPFRDPSLVVMHKQSEVCTVTVSFIHQAHECKFDPQFMPANTSNCILWGFVLRDIMRRQAPYQRIACLMRRSKRKQCLTIGVMNNYRDGMSSWFCHRIIISSSVFLQTPRKIKTSSLQKARDYYIIVLVTHLSQLWNTLWPSIELLSDNLVVYDMVALTAQKRGPMLA